MTIIIFFIKKKQFFFIRSLSQYHFDIERFMDLQRITLKDCLSSYINAVLKNVRHSGFAKASLFCTS